ncbi:hypothetical protein J6S88_06890, partial [bacterium]|nr:hypothetical protein [bacterium]
MTIENEIFKRYSVNFEKLVKYGFQKIKDEYSYEKLFHNDEFRAEIIITKSGVVHGKVIEIESNDEFLPLRVENQQGAF